MKSEQLSQGHWGHTARWHLPARNTNPFQPTGLPHLPLSGMQRCTHSPGLPWVRSVSLSWPPPEICLGVSSLCSKEPLGLSSTPCLLCLRVQDGETPCCRAGASRWREGLTHPYSWALQRSWTQSCRPSPSSREASRPSSSRDALEHTLLPPPTAHCLEASCLKTTQYASVSKPVARFHFQGIQCSRDNSCFKLIKPERSLLGPWPLVLSWGAGSRWLSQLGIWIRPSVAVIKFDRVAILYSQFRLIMIHFKPKALC